MKKWFGKILGFAGISLVLCSSPADAETRFAPLSPALLTSMVKQREFVAALVAKNLAGKLTATAADFTLLQSIVDKRLLRPDQTWELQALGICYGDALVEYVPGLKWTQVTDEYGTDPTLRFKDSSIQINALTSISKRVERGDSVDVADMAEQAKQFLANDAARLR